jgi:hypothetical protein
VSELQLSLDDLLAEANGKTFGEWVESLPAAVHDPYCAEFPRDECRWAPSCRSDGCWRQECERTGQPLYGIGPSVRSVA